MIAMTKRPHENNLPWTGAGLEDDLAGFVVELPPWGFGVGIGGGGFGTTLANMSLSPPLPHPPSGSTLVAPPLGPPPIPTPSVIFLLTLKLSNLLTLK